MKHPGIGGRKQSRRAFMTRGMATAGAAMAASAIDRRLFADNERETDGRPLTKGDAAILRFLAAAELVESDLWQQYTELGGAVSNDLGFAGGGSALYVAALESLDEDMPQYITDNTDDEISHAAFINAYLQSKGAEPVNLDQFRTVQ